MQVFGSLQNASIETLSTLPTTAVAGRFYINAATNNVEVDDGTVKRALLRNDGRAIIGTDSTAGNNVRFHHAGQGLLQFVIGSDTTAENASSTTLAQVGLRASNLATQPATGNVGRLYYNTTSNGLNVETAAGFLQFSTLTGTETLLNKTLTAPSVDVLSITDQSATPSTPISGTKLYTKNGNVYKLASDGLEQAVGSGSGSGSFNYLNNGDFESGISTAQYATTTINNGLPSGTGPTVGNTANSITLSSETSSPLRKAQSLKATASSAWAAGHGFSLGPVFTVQPQDLGKILNITVNYRVVSGGTTLQWAGTPGAQSLQIAIYDLSGAWVASAPGALGFNQANGSGQVTATFQTSVTAGQQYQVFVINGVASTGSVSVLFDDCSVSPNLTNSADTRNIVFQGQVPSSTAMTANTTALPLTSIRDTAGGWSASQYTVGIQGDYQISGTLAINVQAAIFAYVNGTLKSYLGGNGVAAGARVTLSGTLTNLKPGDVITIRTDVNSTITGASSAEFINFVRVSGQSQGPDARVIAMHAQMNANPATTTTGTTMIYDSVLFDLNGAYNKTTGIYTVQTFGVYEVCAAIAYFGSGGLINLMKNGVVYERLAQNATAKYQMTGGTTILCVPGDQLSIQGLTSTNDAIFQAPTLNFLSIKRISGPTAVAASESVNATYSLSANTAVAANAVIPFNTKIKDTHNAYSNGIFTPPSSGQYRITVILQTAGGSSYQIVRKNGGVGLGYIALTGTGLGTGSMSIQLNAGDTVGVYCDATGVTFSGSNSNGPLSQVTFERTGN